MCETTASVCNAQINPPELSGLRSPSALSEESVGAAVAMASKATKPAWLGPEDGNVERTLGAAGRDGDRESPNA